MRARFGPVLGRQGGGAGELLGSACCSPAEASRGSGPGDAVVMGLAAQLLLGAEVASSPQIEGPAR
jgi:hypothetical protein